MISAEERLPKLRQKVIHMLARSALARQVYTGFRSVPMVGHLAHACIDGFLPHGSRIWAQLPAGLGKGLWFYFDPRFELGYANGDHEPWVQDTLEKFLPRGGCFYDVGAHTGFFSLIASRVIGVNGSVVAFEADPDNAQYLRANAKRNGASQIEVVEAAVWSSCGELSFCQASVDSNRTQGHVIGNGKGLKVRAVNLDSIVSEKEMRRPDLIKIDVEGAEWEVLVGAKELLTLSKPRILCEVHDPSRIREFNSLFASMSYSVEHWEPSHPRYSDYRQHYVWAVGN